MARKLCNHTGSPSLTTKLVAQNMFECPMCRVKTYIHEIEEVQVGLERRQGIFESRATARAAEERDELSERTIHKALVRRWRLAKIGLYKDLCLFEELRIEGANKTDWKPQLDKAFQLWEEVKHDCCSVPGYMYTEAVADYVDGQGNPNIALDTGYSLSQDVETEEGDQVFRGWQTVKPRTKLARSTKDTANTTLPDATHQKSTDLDGQSHQEAIQHTKVPTKMERGTYWDGRNRFDLLRDIDVHEAPDLSEPLVVHATPRIMHGPDEVPHVADRPTARIQFQSSPLKRKRSSTPPDKPRSQRTVNVAEKITVICDADASNIAWLPANESSFQRPHFSYTTAEEAHRRSSFWRCASRYKPHTWATTSDYEKLNTSHYRTHWDLYDAMRLTAHDKDGF